MVHFADFLKSHPNSTGLWHILNLLLVSSLIYFECYLLVPKIEINTLSICLA
jgi:hypothetical protein